MNNRIIMKSLSLSGPRNQRKGVYALVVLFVAVLSFINLHHLLSYPPPAQDRQATFSNQHQQSVPPELIKFARQGGFGQVEDISNEQGVVAAAEVVVPAEQQQQLAKIISPSNNLQKPQLAEIEKPKKKIIHQEKESKAVVVRHKGFPPLNRLVNQQEDAITGNVDWLLDIAILGHAKCATTFVMNWLRQHEKVQMWDREVCDLNNRKPATFVRKLYTELPAGEDYLRGYKCPGHFSREPLRYFRQYFPKTKLIVGLRHPVRWFESYYNYRIRHPRGGTMPPPQRLLGKCVHESQGVCTDRANFHRNLAMLAKTNHSEPDQLALLVGMEEKYRYGLSAIPNPVFLYDLGQLYDKNATRKAEFQADFEDFVGLDTPLPSNFTDSSSSKGDDKFIKLDICQTEFDDIRKELVLIGSRAATWITKYFMKSNSVVVSSPNYFHNILQSWHFDPCDENKKPH